MFLPIGDNIRHRSFPVLPCVLIAVNVLVFAYQFRLIVSQEGNNHKIRRVIEDHYDTYGLVPKALKEDGQVFGLLTHMFLHGGLMHLLGNMIVLWAFAPSLEVGFGKATLLGFYIMWGLLAGLAHAASDWSSELPLVGASGAIAGLIGAYTVVYGWDAKIRCLFWLGFHPMKINVPAALFGGLWIGGQLWDASSDPEGLSGIAWWAHIGGFIAGAATAFIFKNDMETELQRDTAGNVSFKDTDDKKEKRQQRQAEQVRKKLEQKALARREDITPVGENECPYCRTSMESAEEISAGLRRCAGANCGRLVYDEALMAGQ